MAVQDEVPKSRLTLTYKTEVQGEPETVNLPLRLLVLGDFSKGASQDRKKDLEERRMRTLDGTNLDTSIKDMGITLKLNVANKVDPANQETLDLTLPLEGMKSFNPEVIAQHIPKLKSLLLVKKLLLEVQSNLANVKEFRKLVEDLYGDEAAFTKLREELKAFEGFKVPAKA